MKSLYYVWPLALCATFYIGVVLSKNTAETLAEDAINNQQRHLQRHLQRPSQPANNSNTLIEEHTLSLTNQDQTQPLANQTRLSNLLQTIEQSSESELRQLLEFYAQQKSPEALPIEMRFIVEALLAFAPTNTLDYLESHELGAISSLVNDALWTLAKTSPQVALNWATKTDDSTTLVKLAYVARGAALTDPRLALEILAGVKSSKLRTEAVREIAPEIVTLPFEEIWAWMKKYSKRNMDELVAKMSGEKLIMAANAYTGDPDMDIRQVIRPWFAKETAACLQWISQQPTEEASRNATTIMQQNIQDSVEIVYQWLQQFKDHRSYKHLITAFIRQARESSPELAAQEIHHLTGNDRAYHRQELYKSWSKINPAAAKAFLEQDKKIYPYDKTPYNPYMWPRRGVPFRQR